MSAPWPGLRRLFHIATRRGAGRDADSEIDFHLESRARDLMTRGHDAASARSIAESEFGDVADARRALADLTRRRYERTQRALRLEAFKHDVATAARSLRRTPAMTTMLVALLVLGVGANAATFAVADELFVRTPAGVGDPANITRLYLRTSATIDHIVTVRPTIEFAAYDAITAAVGQRATLAAYAPPDSVDVSIGGSAHSVRVVYATTNYFSLLGARISLGRSFDANENRLGGGAPVAVISHALWQRAFGGDSTVLGKRIGVAAEQYTVIGVATEGFSGPDLDRTDLWLPIAMYPGHTSWGLPWYRFWYSLSYVRVLARLAPTTTAPELAAIATAAYRNGQREQEQSGGNQDLTGELLTGPLLEARGPTMSAAEGAVTSRLVGVTVVVSLVACANVANLLLLRGLRRRREIAIRLAFGIPRARLLRQFVLESVLLAAVSSIPAVFIAAWGGAALRAMILPSMHWSRGSLNWRIVGASIAVAMLSAVAAGIAPALRASRTDVTAALSAGGREGGTHTSALRTALLTVQAALSVVLLAGAGFFVYSLRVVRAIDVGYDVDRVVYGSVLFRNPANGSLAFARGARAAEFAAGLRDVSLRVRGNPAIASVTISVVPPMGQVRSVAVFFRDGTSVPDVSDRPAAIFNVEPSYFSTTGMTLLHGRFFAEADGAEAHVAVVSETAAQTYWPGRDAIGQCLIVGRPDRGCATVVGVVRSVHLLKFIEAPSAQVFVPIGVLAQPTWIVARAAPGRTGQASALLRQELARAFPSGEPPYVMSVARAHEPELRTWRVGATLFSLFGGLAVIVATIGVYSLLAYAVNQRLHELGVRIALGASRSQLLQLVFGQSVRALGIGVAGGIVLTLLLGRLVASLLYGVSPTNPLVLAAAGVTLLLAGALGSAVPAWRATRVDPVVALRAE